MLVRREAAEQVGWLDPDFFVYSDETDFCKRLHDAGWRILFVPQARGDPPRPALDRRRRDAAAHRRVPPQPRPLLPQAPACRSRGALWRVCWTWAYLVRAAAATVLPGPRPAPLPAARAPAAQPGARRGHARGAERYNRALSRRPTRATKRPAPVEHADTAQLAAVGGALGSVLVLLARGRFTLLGGPGRAGRRRGRAGAVARGRLARQALERRGRRGGARSASLLLGGGRRRCWPGRPAWVPVAVLLAAPFRPPIAFDSSSRFLVSIAEDGRLGRLLPLYFVLAAAAASRSAGGRCAAGQLRDAAAR